MIAIELRSDTFTKPSLGMLEAMHAAQVGDDVFGEDPCVNALEEMTAAMFGKAGGLFCPSGTMTNQIGIKCHTQPGDEVICDEMSHIYQYEGGGIAFNSGCSVKLLHGNHGRLLATQVLAAINSDDVHKSKSSLVSLENTTNRGGGACYDFSEIEAIKAVCLSHNLALHLDGARLWNALVARPDSALDYGNTFDSLSLCFSKGLGTPVGSVLVGDAAFIKKARRIRKLFGGGMRQAGYLAAAGIYALEQNISRLTEDHLHAKTVAKELALQPWVGTILPVETNIVIFTVLGKYTAAEMCRILKGKGINCLAISSTQIRFVFHLDVTPMLVDQLIERIKSN